MEDIPWRRKIFKRLQERNQKQHDSFASLITSHVKMTEAAEVSHVKQNQLDQQLQKLKQENIELAIKASTSGGGGAGSDHSQLLEKKVFGLQEELTELHRSKGQNAQQIIDLNNALKVKEKELHDSEKKVTELQHGIERLENANSSYEHCLLEATTANQMLTDEQQALQLAFTSLEEKFRKTQEDNNDLVARWMQIKSQAADQMNAYNDDFRKKRNSKIKTELAEAASEHVNVDEREDQTRHAVAYCVSVPSKSMQTFDAHEGEVNAIKWSPSGHRFATGGADRKVKLWEVQHGKCETKGVLAGSNAAVMSVEFDYEDNLLLATSNDFASRVWSLSNQRLMHTLTGHSGKVFSAKFLGEPTRVVSGSHDRTLKIWDLRRTACIKTIFAGSSCNDLVTMDGTHIISGHFDRKVRFWDTRADASSKEISLQGRVTSLDLAPDRNSLLCCTRDEAIILVDMRMNQVNGTLRSEGFHVGCDWARAVYSPDGEYVMVGSSDGAIIVWNVAKNKVDKILHEHKQAVMACSWCPTGSTLLSCDKGRGVVYWADY